MWDLETGACVHILQGHTGRVNSIKLTDLNHTAVTVSDDFSVRVWDYSTGQCRHVLAGHGAWVSDMALLASAAKAITVSGDDLAVVWDLEEGKCCNVLDGHSAEVNSVVLTRRGRSALHPLLPSLDAVVSSERQVVLSTELEQTGFSAATYAPHQPHVQVLYPSTFSGIQPGFTVPEYITASYALRVAEVRSPATATILRGAHRTVLVKWLMNCQSAQ